MASYISKKEVEAVYEHTIKSLNGVLDSNQHDNCARHKPTLLATQELRLNLPPLICYTVNSSCNAILTFNFNYHRFRPHYAFYKLLQSLITGCLLVVYHKN